jgi:hypothetical protein
MAFLGMKCMLVRGLRLASATASRPPLIHRAILSLAAGLKSLKWRTARLSGKLYQVFFCLDRNPRIIYRSIVNGLRDEDFESSYAGRSSFASDNSMQQPADVQVFFKEHGRSGSKGSNSSFLARKKLPPAKNRPETKVRLE